MVARFLYRTVSLFFFLGAIICWLGGVGGFLLQFAAPSFHLELFCFSVWAFVLAFFLWQARGDAWRAARYHRYDPSRYPTYNRYHLYSRDYP
jgi:hypothetical protein